MEVKKQLESDFLQAFKGKNELAVLVLRQIKTALTNAEIAKNRQALTEEEAIKVIKSEVKRRKDSAALYIQGGRPELADKENKEIEILAKYLPADLGEDVIIKKIAEIISQTGALGPPDTGKVMGLVMKALAGQAYGNVVSRLVKEELGKIK